jgi:hypothetical protein
MEVAIRYLPPNVFGFKPINDENTKWALRLESQKASKLGGEKAGKRVCFDTSKHDNFAAS